MTNKEDQYEEIIKIENLTYEYTKEGEEKGHPAINDLSLSIKKGSFTAIIGRNGSGKSTLAKCLNALLLPTAGKVYVKGYDTSKEEHIWKIRQTAGMVFQNPDNQLVSAVVEDDVAFGPENLGVDPAEIRKRVSDSLYAVNMYDERKKAPHLLSGGQKQRIAIAGVLAMQPECIIFDEPTAMLDPQGRSDIIKIIGELNNNGITVILITHFMEEAAGADHLIVMDQGKIALSGKPAEIFTRSEDLRSLGLDIPFTVDLADRLRNHGLKLDNNISMMEEMVDALCQLKSKI